MVEGAESFRAKLQLMTLVDLERLGKREAFAVRPWISGGIAATHAVNSIRWLGKASCVKYVKPGVLKSAIRVTDFVGPYGDIRASICIVDRAYLNGLTRCDVINTGKLPAANHQP